MKCTYWYEDWFDSEYYHKLYKNRDAREAQFFLDNLLTLLQLPASAQLLDLACGKGRHSIYLSKKNFSVTGIDLSENSIHEACKSATEKLFFYRHDMRLPFRINFYDAVFNLFTSFGYFENEKDNDKVLRSTALALKKNGIFVLDFINAEKAIREIKKSEIKISDGVRFEIKRSFENGFIVKKIIFSDAYKTYHFMEKVRAFHLSDFEKLFQKNGLKIEHVYGDYSLRPFDEKNSDRLIIIAKK